MRYVQIGDGYRIYVALSLFVCLPVLMIWYNQPHDLKKFSPAWAFLVRSFFIIIDVSSYLLHNVLQDFSNGTVQSIQRSVL